ncbi:MAG: haloalkane dehalogenase [Pseudomonadota bacterium]
MTRVTTDRGHTVYRTPDSAFGDLPGYEFAPNYIEVADGHLGQLRMHYLDEGPDTATETLLLLHGEPSWSYLYRKMIPLLSAAGYRVIAPDLIGFGRSDKPARIADYSYAQHVDWMRQFVAQLGLDGITLFCQDWGGLIGLRVVAAEPERFRRVCVANTGLPEGTEPVPKAFRHWQRFARWSPLFPIGKILQKATTSTLSPEEQSAYDAPFPNRRYKAGARAFPLLVPTTPDMPGAAENREAWQQLARFSGPVLTLFSDRDPITRGVDKLFQSRLPSAAGQPHAIMRGGGHFLQEDVADQLVEHLQPFVAA